MGSVISDAVNVVSGLGSAAGDVLSGNVGGAVGDLGKALPSLVDGIVNVACPEAGLVGDLAGSLGGILGQAGGFNPGQAGGLPNIFGLGNLLPGILQNPLGGLGN